VENGQKEKDGAPSLSYSVSLHVPSCKALFWKEDAWAACLKVLVERPRRRTLQRLPPEALDVFYRCEASKQEGMPIAA
jgi:hypothetical protein